MKRLISLKKYSLYIVAGVIIAITISLFFLLGKGEGRTEPSVVKGKQEVQVKLEEKQEDAGNGSSSIVVEVKGAVRKPGVYTFRSEDRIEEAIRRAGGFTRKADTIEINQAAKLEDSMMIYVREKGEVDKQPLSASTVTSFSSRDEKSQGVNVNQADAAELQTINGIGPAKAEAIIAYREENGEFQQIEDLRKISGFGEKTVERLKSQLIVK